MRSIFKKTVALLLSIVMVFASSAICLADDGFTVEDAYTECYDAYPEFFENIKAQDSRISDVQLIRFAENIYDYLLQIEDLDENTFDDYVVDAVTQAFSLTANMRVRNAITAAYPGAVVDAMDGIVADEFKPMYNLVKSLIFKHGMLGDEENNTEPEPTTESTAATEPETEKSTENSTEASSDAATEPSSGAATEPSSEQATEAPTTPATDAPTEAPTAPTSSSNGVADVGDDQPESTTNENGEQPTDASTEQPTAADTTGKFTDMGSAVWAEESVYALVKMGIIAGYTDGTFRPNNSITRAEFAKIIVMASGQYDANATAEFTDVKSKDWYYSYVASAKNLGLVNGRDDGSFDPNAKITRADICTIVYRYIKTINPDFGKDAAKATFKDFASVPSYAQEAVQALSAAGIVSGMGDNKFEPKAYATRAQSAKIVYGAIQVLFE